MKQKKPIHSAFLIDDDNTYVFLTKRIIMMKRLCERLLVFSNGQVALDELRHELESKEELPDLILLDVNMPELDGWSFLDEFVKIKPNLPKPITIYIVSSSVDQRDIERAKQYEEIASYVVKPIRIRELAEIFGIEEDHA